jgi:hypothetical protein
VAGRHHLETSKVQRWAGYLAGAAALCAVAFGTAHEVSTLTGASSSHAPTGNPAALGDRQAAALRAGRGELRGLPSASATSATPGASALPAPGAISGTGTGGTGTGGTGTGGTGTGTSSGTSTAPAPAATSAAPAPTSAAPSPTGTTTSPSASPSASSSVSPSPTCDDRHCR